MTIPELPNDLYEDRENVINSLLASIALEELALAHVVNAEAEKIQRVVGTLKPYPEHPPCLDDLLDVNESVQETLQKVIIKEIILLFKLEAVLKVPDPLDFFDSCCHEE
ncbi:hypothetical protein CD798_00690 [Bacillaceae bacterium SAOS 7]|nr:hypothetical protein CD798_00690 [Bacillaceae bacterium SAOS 7]